MARHHISQKHSQKNADEISDIREQSRIDVRAAHGNGTAALKKSEEQSAGILAGIIDERDQIISWMSGGYSM